MMRYSQNVLNLRGAEFEFHLMCLLQFQLILLFGIRVFLEDMDRLTDY